MPQRFFGSLITGAGVAGLLAAIFGMEAVQWVLVSLFSIAFLPFLILLAVMALGVLVVTVGIALAMLTGESGADLVAPELDESSVEGAGEFAMRYYDLLFSIKHPVPWGLALGLALTSSTIFGVHWWTVVRPLAQTSEQLAQIAQELSSSTSKLVVEGDRLLAQESPLEDAFGRPFVVTTSGLLKTYEVRSLGANADDPADDLCVVAGSTAARVSRAALDLLTGKTPSKSAAYSAIFDLNCPE